MNIALFGVYAGIMFYQSIWGSFTIPNYWSPGCAHAHHRCHRQSPCSNEAQLSRLRAHRGRPIAAAAAGGRDHLRDLPEAIESLQGRSRPEPVGQKRRRRRRPTAEGEAELGRGTRTPLLVADATRGAPGLATRSKKLLGGKGIATSKDISHQRSSGAPILGAPSNIRCCSLETPSLRPQTYRTFFLSYVLFLSLFLIGMASWPRIQGIQSRDSHPFFPLTPNSMCVGLYHAKRICICIIYPCDDT